MVIGFDGSRSFVKHKTGTENYAYQLLKHLAKIDQKNQYIIYLRPGNVVQDWSNTSSRAKRGNLIQHEAPSASPSHNDEGNFGWPENFQFKLLNYPRLWTQVGLALQTFKDPLDILFVPSHTLPIIRKPGLKTVMTVHDLGAEYLPGMHQLKQRLYLGVMTKIQLKTASKLIAVSQTTKDDLTKKVGIDKSRIEVVYEGLNSLEKNDTKVNVLKDYDIDKHSYFFFVGTIQPRKNLARLLKSYAGFLNIVGKTNAPKLVLAGGKGWLSEPIYALPKSLEIEDMVIFTGRISDARLADLYKNALAFTFPSLFEGFGLPVLEAFSAGVPVMTSNSSSLPEVAGDAALLVDPNKTEEMIEGLLKLYNDKQLRETLSSKGFEQLKKFSWEKCAKETIEVLESTVNK